MRGSLFSLGLCQNSRNLLSEKNIGTRPFICSCYAFWLFLIYLEMVSCSPGWPQINCMAQDGLEPLIRLTPPPKR